MTKVIKDFKNNLLKRREIQLVETFEKNPGKEKALEIVLNETKADKEKIAIKSLKSFFGKNKFLIEAFIYEYIKDKIALEKEKKKEKKEVKQ